MVVVEEQGASPACFERNDDKVYIPTVQRVVVVVFLSFFTRKCRISTLFLFFVFSFSRGHSRLKKY